MPVQSALIRDAFASTSTVSGRALATLCKNIGPETVEEVLVTLASLGRARIVDERRFVVVRAA